MGWTQNPQTGQFSFDYNEPEPQFGYGQIEQFMRQQAGMDPGIMRTPGFNPDAEGRLSAGIGPAYRGVPSMGQGQGQGQSPSPFGGMPQPQLNMHPNPFMMFNNAPGSFGARHPHVAGGIEGAMRTLANMGEPSPTIGGNISNVARGLIGSHEMQKRDMEDQVTEQFRMLAPMLPFYHAQMAQAELDAHRRLYDAEAGYYNQRPGKTKQFNPSPYYNDKGEAYQQDLTSGAWSRVPELDNHNITGGKAGGSKGGNLPPWIKTENERAAYFEQQAKGWNFGSDPLHPTMPPDWNKVVTKYKTQRSVSPIIGAYDAKHARGEQTDEERNAVTKAEAEWKMAEAEAGKSRKEIRQQMPPGTDQTAVTAEMLKRKDAARKAKQNYDSLVPQTTPAGRGRPASKSTAPSTADDYLKSIR